MTRNDIIIIAFVVLLISSVFIFGYIDMRKAKETKDYIKFTEKKRIK